MSLVLHQQARCATERIGQHLSPVRHLGLRKVARRKIRKTTGAKPFAQVLDDLGIGTKVEA
jgi:hypothetical protein